jgi:hypothetical protein
VGVGVIAGAELCPPVDGSKLRTKPIVMLKIIIKLSTNRAISDFERRRFEPVLLLAFRAINFSKKNDLS